ncbi:MAG: MgtC/SapB family protein, partial [Anaerolineae bacterium]
MAQYDLLARFGIALLIGVLIGLEREHARLQEEIKAFAGVRTFPLIALLGCAAALISDETAGWTFGLFLLLVGVFIGIAYAVDAAKGHVGLTSEMAAAVVFVCGALAYWDHLDLSAALGVVTFGFLTLKP